MLIPASGGVFYGTTLAGGPKGHGAAYRFTTSGQVAILGSSVYLAAYQGGVVPGAGGAIYGTTISGGSAGHGAVFSIDAFNYLAVLHSFADGSTPNDGLRPQGAL